MPDIIAGWYADPTNEPQQRYWDGFKWTSQTRPFPPPGASAPPRPPAATSSLTTYPTQPTNTPKPPKKASSLAETALAFSLFGLLFSPLFLVGLIVGIVALNKRNAYGVVEGKGKAISAVVVGVVGTILVVIVIASLLSTSITITPPAVGTSQTNPYKLPQTTYTYTITGTSPALDVTYSDASGVAQRGTVRLPFSVTVTVLTGDYDIDAQLRNTGSITCTVTSGGRTIATNTATSQYGIAACYG